MNHLPGTNNNMWEHRCLYLRRQLRAFVNESPPRHEQQYVGTQMSILKTPTLAFVNASPSRHEQQYVSFISIHFLQPVGSHLLIVDAFQIFIYSRKHNIYQELFTKIVCICYALSGFEKVFQIVILMKNLWCRWK